MAIHHESGLMSRRPISRLKLAAYMILQSGTIGLISGAVLGGLFGCALLASIWTGAIGAGLGLGLGLVNGIVLSTITCLFFYPLKKRRFYRAIVKLISAFIAGGGAAVFGPWYFSSTSMTPTSAVLIGFSSVLASVVAGWAGGLAGQKMAHWYEQQSVVDQQELIHRRSLPSSIPVSKFDRHLAAILLSEEAGWISVALFSLLCSFLGNRPLKFLICGNSNADAFSCLPSPRLYTSLIAGFKVTIPIVFLITLIVVLLQNRYRKYHY